MSECVCVCVGVGVCVGGTWGVYAGLWANAWIQFKVECDGKLPIRLDR